RGTAFTQRLQQDAGLVLRAQVEADRIVPRRAAPDAGAGVGSHAMALEHNDPAASAKGREEAADLLVLGGRVVTMNPERRVLHGGGVAVRGDRILAVDGAAALRA